MSELVRRGSTTFIVHVWFETDACGMNSRRGYVEAVADGARHYFGELAEALAFVDAVSRRWAGHAGQAPEYDAGADAEPR